MNWILGRNRQRLEEQIRMICQRFLAKRLLPALREKMVLISCIVIKTIQSCYIVNVVTIDNFVCCLLLLLQQLLVFVLFLLIMDSLQIFVQLRIFLQLKVKFLSLTHESRIDQVQRDGRKLSIILQLDPLLNPDSIQLEVLLQRVALLILLDLTFLKSFVGLFVLAADLTFLITPLVRRPFDFFWALLIQWKSVPLISCKLRVNYR